MKIRTATTLFLFMLALCALPVLEAQAARMGGGRSFGGRPFMSQPAPRQSIAPRPDSMRQSQRQPASVNAAPGGGMAGGAAGGMGGLFAGLLGGTLLGSLLFGGQGAAGGGFGLLDMLVIALLVYFGFRLFRRMSGKMPEQRPQMQSAGQAWRSDMPPNQAIQLREDSSAWGRLRGQAETPVATGVAEREQRAGGGFDQEEFLRGARLAYTRLQEAWDRRDLEDIAHFATPAVMQVLREQMREEPAPSRTEILLVNARLLTVENCPEGERASVLFDVLMREEQNPSDAPGRQVREIWHFLQPAGANAHWRLDGIQQVED